MELCNLNEVRALLQSRGFRFSKSMGQNFLIDSSVPERIAALSGLDSGTAVLEIGPGVGALTSRLSPAAAKVIAVELDRDLIPVLGVTLKEYGNVEIIEGDILKLDIPRLVSEKLLPLRPVVCANLPYNITTPVITALLDSGAFKTVTVMVQREVARRICADAGTPDYGAFSVYCAYHASCRILFDVPPESFIPAPKVYSSVVRMDVTDAPPVQIEDEKLFFRVVRSAFAQRRKTLVNSMSSCFGELSKNEISDILRDCGFDERIRGETLDLKAFADIAIRIRSRL